MGDFRRGLAALAVPFPVFLLLLAVRWNPIYPAILALFAGALGTAIRRPELVRNSLWGGVIFPGLYWSCVYEHVGGKHARSTARASGLATDGRSALPLEMT